MLDGAPSAETMTRFVPPRVETKAPQNYTPLPEFGRPTMSEPPKYVEPTTAMLPQDKALTDRLMAQIMEKPKSKSQEVVPQIEKRNLQEKKTQGFFEKILEWFRNLFR